MDVNLILADLPKVRDSFWCRREAKPELHVHNCKTFLLLLVLWEI